MHKLLQLSYNTSTTSTTSTPDLIIPFLRQGARSRIEDYTYSVVAFYEDRFGKIPLWMSANFPYPGVSHRIFPQTLLTSIDFESHNCFSNPYLLSMWIPGEWCSFQEFDNIINPFRNKKDYLSINELTRTFLYKSYESQVLQSMC